MFTCWLQMHLAADTHYQPEHGIYCSHGYNSRQARVVALNMCRHGGYTSYATSDTSHVNWAIEFNASPLIVGMYADFMTFVIHSVRVH